MGVRDIKSNVKLTVLHAKAAVTTTQSIQGMDVGGFKGACFVIDVGAHTADDLIVTYQEKDTGGSWANIAEADLEQNGNTAQSRALVAGDADTQIYVGYTGLKDNIGVVITDSGTGSVVVGAYVVAGYPDDMPQNS
jgi:hypothetical protein